MCALSTHTPHVLFVQNSYIYLHEYASQVLVRPSFVLSGAAMAVACNSEQLKSCLADAEEVSTDKPVVISKYHVNAKEVEFDAVHTWIRRHAEEPGPGSAGDSAGGSAAQRGGPAHLVVRVGVHHLEHQGRRRVAPPRCCHCADRPPGGTCAHSSSGLRRP